MPDPDYTDLEGYIPPKVKAAAIAGRDALAQSAGQAATRGDAATVEGLKDAATMAPGGFTDNWDEELLGILGGIGEAIGRPFEHPSKTVPKGYREAANAQKLRKAVAMERSPVMGSVGYGLGTAAQTAVAGPLLKGVAGVGGKLARLATGTEKAAEGANMLRRGAVATGNAALPGAITGAGSAESIEDIPEAAGMGALIGTAVTGAASVPGAIRRFTGNPAIAKAADEFADDAALRAAGWNKGQIEKIAKKPGGKKGYLKRQRDLGIGTDWIPTNQRAEEQATEVANRLQTQNEALAGQAADLRIPLDEVAQEVENRAAGMAKFGKKELRATLADEARDFRTRPKRDPYVYHSTPEGTLAEIQKGGLDPTKTRMGDTPEVYFSNTPESADDWNYRVNTSGADSAVMLRTPQTAEIKPHADVPEFSVANQPVSPDKLEYWDAEQGTWKPVAGHAPHPEAQEPGGSRVYKPRKEAFAEPPHEQTFAQLVKDRQGYHEGAFTSETALGQQSKREVGAAINDILERYANKLPDEVGTRWRVNNRDLNTSLEALRGARAGQGGGNLGKGMKIAGAITGALSGTPSVLAGLVGTVPGVQMRAAQGLAAVSRAAQREPTSTLAKVLMRASPSAQTLGRVAVAAQAQQGVEAVREAALQGDEEAVSEHYRQMLTNPEYNREAVKEE